MKHFNSPNLTRRTLLKTSALGVGLLPFAPMRASSLPQRNRVVFVYTPLGAPIELWQPQKPGCVGDISFGLASQPLATVRQHCVFLNNLYVQAGGMGRTYKALGGLSGETTLDIHLGETWNANVRRPNLHLGANVTEEVVSIKNNTEITFAPSAAAVYDELFKQDDMTYSSALDQKFRTEIALNEKADFDKEVDLQIELSALALTRNITNVITLMWGDQQGAFFLPEFPELAGVDFHQAVHSGNRVHYAAFRAYLSAKLAYLIKLLEVTPDENGRSLLDSTLIVQVSDQGDASDHLPENAPFIIAGGKNRFNNGFALNVKGASQYDLMDTIAAAYGVEGVRYGKDLIPGLTKD